jgi:hypothetical protein
MLEDAAATTFAGCASGGADDGLEVLGFWVMGRFLAGRERTPFELA